jgi:hypothetical protein
MFDHHHGSAAKNASDVAPLRSVYQQPSQRT